MALGVSSFTASAATDYVQTGYGTTLTLGSAVTPPANSLLLANVITGAGDKTYTWNTDFGSWTVLDSRLVYFSSARHEVVALLTGASPGTGDIQVSWSGNTNGCLSAIVITGGDVTSIANAIPQEASAGSYASPASSLSVDLSSAPSGGSVLAYATGNGTGDQSGNFTNPEAGWTQHVLYRCGWDYNLSGDQTGVVDYTVGGQGRGGWHGEVAVAGGGGGGSVNLRNSILMESPLINSPLTG